MQNDLFTLDNEDGDHDNMEFDGPSIGKRLAGANNSSLILADEHDIQSVQEQVFNVKRTA